MAVAYAYIEQNKRKSALLACLFPLSFAVFVYGAVLLSFVLWEVLGYFRTTSFLTFASTLQLAHIRTLHVCEWLLPMSIALSAFWAYIALKDGDSVVLSSISGLRILPSWEDLETYRVLENLCITCGMPVPQLYVLDDESLNAFSAGVRPERSAIILSAGLLKQLNRNQLEGVLAHELAHIRNYDTRLMLVMIMCLAFFTFAGEYLFYGTERENFEGWHQRFKQARYRPPVYPFLMYVGLLLMGYGYIIAPLIRFALTRSREAQADAEAALLTRNPRALSQALWRVSRDSRLEALDVVPLIGILCLEKPEGDVHPLFTWLSGLGSSHPPIEERMRALNDMDGLFLQTHP